MVEQKAATRRLEAQDQTALASAKKANQLLVSAWYKAHFSDLSRKINAAFGAGPPDPEDVAQRTFEKLLSQENLSVVQNVKAYLWHIARNTFLTEVRSITRRKKLDFAIEEMFFAENKDSLTPERVLSARQQLDRVRNAFALLPADVKEAFVMHRLDGISLSAIAKHKGIGRKRATLLVAKATIAIDEALAIDETGERT